MIRLEQVSELGLWQRVVERLGWQGGALDDVTRHHIIREFIGQLVDDVLEESLKAIAELEPGDALDVQRHPEPVVRHSPGQQALNAELKDFLLLKMYRHFRVVRMQTRAERFVEALFSSYMKEPRQLPEEYRAKLDEEPPHRVVADYIASLTDRSALGEYQQLFDPITRL